MAYIRPNTRVGPYTVVRALPEGRGGMARIYEAIGLAEDGTESRVALKVAKTAPLARRGEQRSDQDELEQFYFEALNNEVEYLKRLRHPSIVRIYPIPWAKGMKKEPYVARATNIEGAPWFCVMEYLQGGSVENRIQHLKRLPLREAVEIAHQLCLALDYIHSKDVAHLDVKPDNVLFRYPLADETRPEAVLLDFGIARREGKKEGLEAGAIPYMPPERLVLLRGTVAPESKIDKKLVDVYGVGMLLYKMLTGRLPFGGASRSSITSAILRKAPTRPSKYNRAVPQAVEEIVLRSLDKDPQRRPSAQMLASMLDEALSPPRYVLTASKELGSGAGPTRRRPLNVLTAAGFVGFMMISALEFGVIWTLLGAGPMATLTPTLTPIVLPPTTVVPVSAPTSSSGAVLSRTPAPVLTESAVPAASSTPEMEGALPTSTRARPTRRPSPTPKSTPTS